MSLIPSKILNSLKQTFRSKSRASESATSGNKNSSSADVENVSELDHRDVANIDAILNCSKTQEAPSEKALCAGSLHN